jgi:hypothetical protein
LIQKNFRAMDILHCGLNADEYERLSACDSAKEMWDKMELAYDGNNQTKPNIALSPNQLGSAT